MVGKVTNDILPSGSRLPGIFGVSPFKTPNDELAYSINALQGKPRPPFKAEAADWGNTLETTIILEAAKRAGLEIKELQVDYALSYQVDGKDVLQVSLDSILEGDGRELHSDPELGIYVIGDEPLVLDGPGACESKLTASLPEDVPAEYRGPIQLQAQMLCGGFKWGVIATLFRGVELRLFFYKASQAAQDKIIEKCKDFIRRVEEGDWYPALSPADAVTAYPATDDSSAPVDLTSRPEGDFVRRLVEIKEKIALLEDEKDQLQAKIMDQMAMSERAFVKDSTGRVQYEVKWAMRNYKAQPEKTTPAKPARVERSKTLAITEAKG
jgi:predicted phage-related endonuclease